MAVRGASGNASDAAGLNRESDRRPAFLQGASNSVPVQAKSSANAGVSGSDPASETISVLGGVLDEVGSGAGNAAGPAKTGTATRGPSTIRSAPS